VAELPTTGKSRAGGVPPPLEDLSRDVLLKPAVRVTTAEGSLPALGGIPLRSRIGRGGMGAVYYAIHPRLGLEVAVKVLDLGAGSNDPRATDRFIQEARLAARIRNPHLVEVLDANQENGLYYLVMEYVSGTSAGQLLANLSKKGQQGLAEIDAVRTALAAAEGLAAAHEEGIVHRDIKPENILIPRNRRETGGEFDYSASKLADLGLARAEEQTSAFTQSQSVLGTPEYMSPEQISDPRGVRQTSDVYGLGAAMYALLTGRPPFYGPNAVKVLHAVVYTEATPIREIRGDIWPATSSIAERCMLKDPEGRYPDGAALAKALRERLKALVEPPPTKRMQEGAPSVPPGEQDGMPLKVSAMAGAAHPGFEATLVSQPTRAAVPSPPAGKSAPLGSFEATLLQSRGGPPPLPPASSNQAPPVGEQSRGLGSQQGPPPFTGAGAQSRQGQIYIPPQPPPLPPPSMQTSSQGYPPPGLQSHQMAPQPVYQSSQQSYAQPPPVKRQGSLLTYFLVLLIMGALGAGGYFGYRFYQEEQARKEFQKAIAAVRKDRRAEGEDLQRAIDALKAALVRFASRPDSELADANELLAVLQARQELLKALDQVNAKYKNPANWDALQTEADQLYEKFKTLPDAADLKNFSEHLKAERAHRDDLLARRKKFDDLVVRSEKEANPNAALEMLDEVEKLGLADPVRGWPGLLTELKPTLAERRDKLVQKRDQVAVAERKQREEELRKIRAEQLKQQQTEALDAYAKAYTQAVNAAKQKDWKTVLKLLDDSLRALGALTPPNRSEGERLLEQARLALSDQSRFDVLLQSGRKERDDGDYRAAIGSFQEAGKILPNRPEPNEELNATLLKLTEQVKKLLTTRSPENQARSAEARAADQVRAADLARIGADLKFPQAMLQLGRCYQLGMGLEKNQAEAIVWFRAAADANLPEAQWVLGEILERGEGVTIDLGAAAALFRKAADQGNVRGQYALGFMYENGKGFPKDLDEAAKYYKLAADRGYPLAVDGLKRVTAQK